MGHFSESAKQAYKMKSVEERKALQQIALDNSEQEILLTDCRIAVEGGKIFKKIQSLVCVMMLHHILHKQFFFYLTNCNHDLISIIIKDSSKYLAFSFMSIAVKNRYGKFKCFEVRYLSILFE